MARVAVSAELARRDMARAGPLLKVFRTSLRLVFRLLFRVHVEGLENLPGVPCIVALNHLGWTDPFLPLLFFPVEPRIYVLGERQVMLRSRWRRWILGVTKVMVPLDRNEPRQALQTMTETLKDGGSLIIFPEGQLGIREGELGPLQIGASRLALQVNVPIVPVGLTGTGELWLRRRLTLRVGAPLLPADVPGTEVRTRGNTMTTMLTTALSGLLPGDEEHPRHKPLGPWLTKLL